MKSTIYYFLVLFLLFSNFSFAQPKIDNAKYFAPNAEGFKKAEESYLKDHFKYLCETGDRSEIPDNNYKRFRIEKWGFDPELPLRRDSIFDETLGRKLPIEFLSTLDQDYIVLMRFSSQDPLDNRVYSRVAILPKGTQVVKERKSDGSDKLIAMFMGFNPIARYKPISR